MWPKICSHVIECRSAGVQVGVADGVAEMESEPKGVTGIMIASALKDLVIDRHSKSSSLFCNKISWQRNCQ